MKKWIILSLIMLGLIEVVGAVCCPMNQNCSIIETCQSGSCGVCSLTLYNKTGFFNQSGDMGIITSKTYEYNVTDYLNDLGTWPYSINCSNGETCIAGDCAVQVKQNCEETSMDPIAAIILIPIALAFFYILIAWFLKAKAHWAFSIALLLLAFIEFFRAYNFGLMTVARYYNWPEMQDMIGSQVYNYGIMYGVVIAYFFLHLLIVMTMSVWKKHKTGDYEDYDE